MPSCSGKSIFINRKTCPAPPSCPLCLPRRHLQFSESTPRNLGLTLSFNGHSVASHKLWRPFKMLLLPLREPYAQYACVCVCLIICMCAIKPQLLLLFVLSRSLSLFGLRLKADIE